MRQCVLETPMTESPTESVVIEAHGKHEAKRQEACILPLPSRSAAGQKPCMASWTSGAGAEHRSKELGVQGFVEELTAVKRHRDGKLSVEIRCGLIVEKVFN